MPADEARSIAVDAVHTRPCLLIRPPLALVQLVFMNDGDRAKDHATMAELSERMGASDSHRDRSYHRLSWNEGALLCEKHTEFSTYLWSAALDPETGIAAGEDPFKHGFTPPGPVLCGIRLEVLPWSEKSAKQIDRFEVASLCHSVVEDGMADIVTDFRQDAEGLTRILILDRGLTSVRLGVLIQRLLEVETYRVLALLGRPASRALVPRIRQMEERLNTIAGEMRESARINSEKLLSELTDFSAELEAECVAILYRFGASRAYYEIVEERLSELEEKPVPGCFRWCDYLHRGIAPAMRTCRSVQERLANLGDKLSGVTSLLSSWINMQLEHQNGRVLSSMNDRAQLQLRLQQTVEGLSVAAISYYVTGLLAHLIEGIPGLHGVIEEKTAVAIMIPFVVLAVWWTVRRIRLSHSEKANHH